MASLVDVIEEMADGESIEVIRIATAVITINDRRNIYWDEDKRWDDVKELLVDYQVADVPEKYTGEQVYIVWTTHHVFFIEQSKQEFLSRKLSRHHDFVRGDLMMDMKDYKIELLKCERAMDDLFRLKSQMVDLLAYLNRNGDGLGHRQQIREALETGLRQVEAALPLAKAAYEKAEDDFLNASD